MDANVHEGDFLIDGNSGATKGGRAGDRGTKRAY